MPGILQEIRWALRGFHAAPGFAATAVATLALGLGGATAMVSVADAVLVRPTAFDAADRLVRITGDQSRAGVFDVGVSIPEIDAYRDAGAFESIAGLYPINANLTGGARPVRLEGLFVGAAYFDALRVRAEIGRVFTQADEPDRIGTIAVITDGLWRRELGSDPDVLGRIVKLDGDAVEIIGVLPASFRHPGRGSEGTPELFIPVRFRDRPFDGRPLHARLLAGALARVRPSISIDAANARLLDAGTSLRARHPEIYPAAQGWRPRAVALDADINGPLRPALLTLTAAVGAVLLIACANVANLMVARGASRRRELAVRHALGATRWHVVRQVLVESVVLGVAGGIAGLLLAQWGIAAATALLPANLPIASPPALDLRVFVVAMAVSIAAGAFAGIWPALALAPDARHQAMQDGGRGSLGARHRSRVRSALVIVQVAAALALLVIGGLLARSFSRALAVDPGFTADGLLAARLWMPLPNDRDTGPYADPAMRRRFYDALLARLRTTAGIESAAFTSRLPLVTAASVQPFAIEGRPLDPVDTVEPSLVSPGYFDVIGAPLRRGRAFTDDDDLAHPPVLMVSESFERRYFAGDTAVGKRLRPGGPASTAPWFTIVGVVADIHSVSLDRPPAPQLYRSLWQTSNLAIGLVVRTAGDPAAFEQPLRDAVLSLDPNLPLFGVRPLSEIVASSLSGRRFAVVAVGVFAMLALLLAGVGLYGVLSYLVAQRTSELGLRMALGASPARIVRSILVEGLRLAAAGIAIGLIAAAAAARAVSTMLFGISPFDAVTFVGLAAGLTAVALTACWVPARRALRIDPLTALRTN